MDEVKAREETEQEKLIDIMRLTSLATGKIYDIQLLNLKCIPLVLFGADLKNEFKIDCDKKTIQFELTGKADYPETEKKVRLGYLVQSVQKILGNYEVSVLLNEKASNGRKRTKPANVKRKGRAKPNAGGKKRVRKVRSR